METRNIKISKETAIRWYNGSDEELKQLAVQTYPEIAVKELPKSWEELGKISGWYVTSNSFVNNLIMGLSEDEERCNLFATKEQAEASIALAQLSQLMKVYNSDWVANWCDAEQIKHCIEFYNGEIFKDAYNGTQKFLSFKDAETRDLFLKNFEQLILTAKPLL
jgi:hypothetical protein